MPRYIWSDPVWPAFHWDANALLPGLTEARFQQGQFLGVIRDLGMDARLQSEFEATCDDVIKTSAIEGEVLNRASVRSSIARRLGIPDGGMITKDRKVEGVVDMIIDATKNTGLLTPERIFGWHAALFPTGYSGLHKIEVGQWRTGPIEVVSEQLSHRQRVAEATGEQLPFRLAPFGEGFDGSNPAPNVPEALTVPGGDNPFADLGHRIDEEGIQAHDRMAEAWAGATDFGDVPGQLAQVIADNGNQGRGDVSDLLSRLHQRDPASAAHLQDAVGHAGGGRVPFADGTTVLIGSNWADKVAGGAGEDQLAAAVQRESWRPKGSEILEGGGLGVGGVGAATGFHLFDLFGKSGSGPVPQGNPTQREMDNAERIRRLLQRDNPNGVRYDIYLVPKPHQLPR